jgi:hypothetical protein
MHFHGFEVPTRTMVFYNIHKDICDTCCISKLTLVHTSSKYLQHVHIFKKHVYTYAHTLTSAKMQSLQNKGTHIKYHETENGRNRCHYIYNFTCWCTHQCSKSKYSKKTVQKDKCICVWEKGTQTHSLTLSSTHATWDKETPRIRRMEMSWAGFLEVKACWQEARERVRPHTRRHRSSRVCAGVRVRTCVCVCEWVSECVCVLVLEQYNFATASICLCVYMHACW